LRNRAFIETNPAWQVCGEAVNGAEAVEMAKRLNPDLVILDLAMPIMNGLDAAERLSWEMPHVPLLLCTFYATNELAGHARKAGISGLVSKADGIDGNLVSAIRALVNGGQFFPLSLTEN
jgi:DNA-binding NarL/FixJ family response regulator